MGSAQSLRRRPVPRLREVRAGEAEPEPGRVWRGCGAGGGGAARHGLSVCPRSRPVQGDSRRRLEQRGHCSLAPSAQAPCRPAASLGCIPAPLGIAFRVGRGSLLFSHPTWFSRGQVSELAHLAVAEVGGVLVGSETLESPALGHCSVPAPSAALFRVLLSLRV